MSADILSHSLRRKLASVVVAMAIFACLGAVTTAAVGRPVEIGATNAVLIGLGVGLFEEFYVQSPRGNWLRAMHPVRSIAVYIAVIIALYFIAVHIAHLLLNRLDDLPTVYRRLPYGLTFFTIFSVVGVLMMRVVHFIGLDTLFHLTIGTYHRPVRERRVLLFLDINGSTALGEKLGPLRTRELVRKFLSDVTRPIVDRGGDIYLYKGDGLIATWRWDTAVRNDAILLAVDDMFAVVARERRAYETAFGIAPDFRIGIHGGEVVVSEQGDARRSIGIYGDTINIAARMEEAARGHSVHCVISRVIADALADQSRLRLLGEEKVKGISASIPICAYATAADALAQASATQL
jgi:class 3 adenylate cyclase